MRMQDRTQIRAVFLVHMRSSYVIRDLNTQYFLRLYSRRAWMQVFSKNLQNFILLL